MPSGLAFWTLLVAVAVFAAWLTVRALRWRARRRGRYFQRRGERAERRAEKLLRQHGYAISARQPPASAHIRVDGVRRDIGVVGDLLVTRDDHTFLVEVKTGGRRSPYSDTTRRQLLEYALVFDVDGLLLVDAQKGEIMEISFDYFDR